MIADKKICSFALALPIGYSQRMGKAYPGVPASELFRAFGTEFGQVQFKVDHLAEHVFRIRIAMSEIPTREGKMNLTETITGMTGDVLRLTYGQVVTIEGPHGGGLMIRISPRISS